MMDSEMLVYTNDGKAVLYKHGLKNRTVDRHMHHDPTDLFSKRASDKDAVFTLDVAAADLPARQDDVDLGTGE